MANTRPDTFLAPAAAAFARLYRALRRRLAPKTAEQSEPAEVQTDLCLAQSARLASHYAALALPEGLLRACSAEPLDADDARFVGRDEQTARLLAALERWRTGRNAMVAVTGPQGCGISSLLRQLSRHVTGHETCRYGELKHRPYDVSQTLALLGGVVGCEQPCASVEQLVEYINGLPPQVIVIDNGHFLACRIMGANEAIRVFGAVMVATQQRHLWVLGCQEHAWRRLVYVYHADRYFTDLIELPLFSEAELGLGLAARLQAAGLASVSGTAGDERLPTALARQMPTLHKLSNGKYDLACFYFLTALLVQDEDGQPDIQAVRALDFSALKDLISEELFTLAEVAAHGQLTIDDHCAVFRSTHDESWLLLERLYHRCLLDRDDTGAGPGYFLVPPYSDVITRHLAKLNYLY
ncbi:MAG: ATP-binding protein [Gammaproteobacteria bacterium]